MLKSSLNPIFGSSNAFPMENKKLKTFTTTNTIQSIFTYVQVHSGCYIEAIRFLVNFIFSLLAILDFEKMAFWSLRCLGLWGCQDEAPCQIWWNSDERFGNYSSFSKFQNGGRQPSCLLLLLQISWFPVVDFLQLRRWCCVSNLVKIGFAVQMFLRFFFLVGNTFLNPKIGVQLIKGWKFKI